jgi:hypothetical protein
MQRYPRSTRRPIVRTTVTLIEAYQLATDMSS